MLLTLDVIDVHTDLGYKEKKKTAGALLQAGRHVLSLQG
jgi:hypothetical protein